MNILFLLFLLTSVIASSNQNSIVRGTNASITNFPFIVSLLNDKIPSQFCAGTLISNNSVVTAAHCFTGIDLNATNTSIRTGSESWNSGGDVIKASNISIHPKWDPNNTTYDVATLQLERPVVFNEVSQAISLIASSYGIASVNEDFTALGWGRAGASGVNAQSSPSLKQANVTYVSKTECDEANEDANRDITLASSQLCIREGTGETCNGDSGGPVVLRSGEEWVLAGIVSLGFARCALVPTILTYVGDEEIAAFIDGVL